MADNLFQESNRSLGFFIGKFLFNFRYSVNPRKPALFFALVKKFLLAHQNRKRYSFRGVELALDYACNFHCPHCNIKAMINHDRESLTLEDYKRIARQLDELGGVVVCLTGGEPLISNKLEPVLTEMSPHRRHVTIQTNGYYLTDEKLKELKRLGVDVIQLSLDDLHDDWDPESPNVTNIRNLIRKVRRSGLKAAATTVVTHENLHSVGFNAIVDFAKQENILLLLNIAQLSGEWAGRKDLLLTPQDQKDIRELVKRYVFIRTDFETNLAGWGCPAFKEKVYISPYGDVLGCTFLQMNAGNVKTETLRTIRERMMSFEFFDHYHVQCPVGEDPAFYESFFKVYADQQQYPVPCEKVFTPTGKFRAD